jgi:hypothetical protein
MSLHLVVIFITKKRSTTSHSNEKENDICNDQGFYIYYMIQISTLSVWMTSKYNEDTKIKSMINDYFIVSQGDN